MDSSPLKEAETVIDIESCTQMTGQEAETPRLSDNTSENIVSVTICGVSMSLDEDTTNTENVDKDKANNKNYNNINKKEKRSSLTAKKPPKPPRPAKGLSLDAADRKLIREISELAMMKRARVERIKKTKVTREHSSFSASFGGNLIAVVFTIIFCIVVIVQGISPGNKSPLPAILVEGSHVPNGVALGNNAVLKDRQNFSSNGVPLISIESPDPMNPVPASGSKDELEKAVH